MATLAVSAGVALTPSAAGAATNASPAATPHLTVTPSTNLVDLQTVHVVGQHFPASSSIVTVECLKGATGPSNCDLSTVQISPSDASGSFTVDRYVRRIITVGPITQDCAHAPGACVMAGADVTSPRIAASVPLGFNPKVPPKKPSLRVTPSTNLVDHQLVKLVGGGVVPNGFVLVLQCAPGAPTPATCDPSTEQPVSVGPRGSFYLSYPVHRLLIEGGGTGSIVDCGTLAAHCQIAAISPGSSALASAPITFNKAKPPATQSLFVFPHHNLVDKQLVTASGSGYTPGIQVTIVECRSGVTSQADCDASTVAYATAGFVGYFATDVPVHRILNLSTGPLDCASAPGACVLAAVDYSRYLIEHALTPLSFNPKVPPAKVFVTVTPNTNLDNNQPVGVQGRGFTPLSSVQVSECSVAAVGGVTTTFCGGAVTVAADLHGHISTTYFVHSVIVGPAGLVGCRAKPGRCTIGVSEGFSPTPTTQVPLSFG